MNTNVKIVGIGGLPRSGKDTLADLLVEKGWFGFSFGDYIRMYSRERHKEAPDPISVANMTETSNWLRDQHGPDVVLQEALKEFEEKQANGGEYVGLVLFSVRAPVEVDWILAHHGELIWVEADDEVRLKRNNENLREGEVPVSLEEFKRQEALQWQPQPGVPPEAQMDIAYVKQHATKTLVNNSDTIDEFLQNARQQIGLDSTTK